MTEQQLRDAENIIIKEIQKNIDILKQRISPWYEPNTYRLTEEATSELAHLVQKIMEEVVIRAGIPYYPPFILGDEHGQILWLDAYQNRNSSLTDWLRAANEHTIRYQNEARQS